MNKQITDNEKLTTVLVTGGAGFIGSHLLELLLENGYKIIALEHSAANISRLDDIKKKIKIFYSDKDDLEKVFQKNKIDAVIHLATRYLKVHSSLADVDSIIDTNIKFPSRLCELCVQNKVKYFINTGTFFEYKMKDTPLKEEDDKWAYNLYASSKLAFEEVLKFYAQSFDFKVIDFKLFAPFGDRDNEKLMSLLVKILNSGEETDFSGGEQSWNFTYVKDIALAYLLALQKIEKMKNGYELINIGYNKSVSIRDIASILEKISGKKFNINWGAKPYSDQEIFYANADISKAQKLLGWKPEYGLEEGLKRTYDYFTNK